MAHGDPLMRCLERLQRSRMADRVVAGHCSPQGVAAAQLLCQIPSVLQRQVGSISGKRADSVVAVADENHTAQLLALVGEGLLVHRRQAQRRRRLRLPDERRERLREHASPIDSLPHQRLELLRCLLPRYLSPLFL